MHSRAQASLEYLFILAIVLISSAIFVLVALPAFTPQSAATRGEICKLAASNCKSLLFVNNSASCGECDSACMDSRTNASIYPSAVQCCKAGKPENIYSGFSGSCVSAPIVLGVYPFSGATVPLSTAVRIAFSKAMDQSSAEQAFSLNDTSVVPAATVAGTFSWQDDEMTFTPSSLLVELHLYKVSVNTTAKDLAQLGLAQPFQSTFTVSDVGPPAIISFSPANNAADLSVRTTVTVKFSEPMNQQSAQQAFSLNDTSAIPTTLVSGTFSWQGNDMTFISSSSLQYAHTYLMRVNTTAKDLAGNALFSSSSSSFTTIPILGFAVGAGGIILKSTNGGETWVSSPTSAANNFIDLCIYNKTHGWAVNQTGVIYVTTNGGSSWAIGTGVLADYVSQTSCVPNVPNGTVMGYAPTYGRVTNIGTTPGNQIQITGTHADPGLGPSNYGVSFINLTHGWTAVGTDNPECHRTANAGASWTASDVASSAYSGPWGVFFLNASHGWAVAKDADGSPAELGQVFRTTDGGITWAQSNGLWTNIGFPKNLLFVNASHGFFMAGSYGGDDPNAKLFKSTNGGAFWNYLTPLYTFPVIINRINFLNETWGFAAGVNGAIFKTTDGGATWVQKATGVTNELQAIYFAYSAK